MIVPLLLGLKDFALAPLTWTLIFMNMGFYFVTANPQGQSTSGRDTFFESRNLQRTGIYYRQYLGLTEIPSAAELVLWGGKGVRDPGFLQAAQGFPLKGDEIEIKQWREKISDLRDQATERSTTQFGLPRDPHVAYQKPLTWITYQFMHASPIHLLSNMVFLLLFGIAIERLVGSLTLMLVGLGGGIFGAWFSLFADAPSALPMVGASASVSAMIAFYVLAEPRKNIRFFYFFSPFKGFYGEIFLSKWWILPLCLLPDLATWLTDFWTSKAQLIGQSVATTAHVGGALFGAAAALLFLQFLGEKGYEPPAQALEDSEPTSDWDQSQV